MSNVIDIVTPPSGVVVTLEQAKAHLRVTDDEEDLLITSITSAATANIEAVTNRLLRPQTWAMYLDYLPACGFWLPRSPIDQVDSIQYFDTDSEEQTVAPEVYKWDLGTKVPSKVTLRSGQSWPSDIIIERGAVKVTFTAGYAAAEVPNDLIAAIKLLIGHYHENREEVVTGAISTALPKSVTYLIDPHKIKQVRVSP